MTTDARVAITGVGLITPLGDDPAAIGAAIGAGQISVAASAESIAGVSPMAESRILEFDATRYANVRGMRLFNRTTCLGISAGTLALANAGLGGTTVAGAGLGLVVGSTYAHLDTLIAYDRSLVAVGIQQTNPALMPLAISSAPGAAMAMAFGAKAFAVTLASAGASGLDALGLGMRMVAAGRADACLVVGAFALCHELSLSSGRAGQLAPPGAMRVFDARHCGRAFGEAGAAIVLERFETARARGVTPKGVLSGYAAAFAPAGSDRADALRRACDEAIGASGRSPRDLAFLSSGANGLPDTDDAEARALLSFVGQDSVAPVIAIKSSLGDLVDAAGVVQAILALDGLDRGSVSPIAGLQQPAIAGLRYAHAPTAITGRAALVTATSDVGGCAAIVVEQDDGVA